MVWPLFVNTAATTICILSFQLTSATRRRLNREVFQRKTTASHQSPNKGNMSAEYSEGSRQREMEQGGICIFNCKTRCESQWVASIQGNTQKHAISHAFKHTQACSSSLDDPVLLPQEEQWFMGGQCHAGSSLMPRWLYSLSFLLLLCGKLP